MRFTFVAIVLFAISTTCFAQDTIKVSTEGIKPALAERSEEFSALTEETGGNLWLPSSAEEMVREAREVASDIDAQYVMSYRPMPPLASSGPTEYRRIEVLSRRVGLTVKSRRGYVVRPDLLLN